MNSVSRIKEAFLFGESEAIHQLEHINREDSAWVEQFASDLDTSPQRKQVVLDCIYCKFGLLTLVNK